jgi:hypothetical protein
MPATPELCALLGLAVEVAIVEPNGANVPAEKLKGGRPSHVTIHETDNANVGANARMHRNFVANGGGVKGVSFTWSVDSDQAVQILPEDSVNYAQGTLLGNQTGVSIEMCVNRDGDIKRTRDNAAKLTAAILVAHDLPLSAVKQHNAWSGKDCPKQLRATPGGWDRFMEAIAGYVHQLQTAIADVEPTEPGETQKLAETLNGFTIREPFLSVFEQGGVPRFGLPITPLGWQDFPNVGRLECQYFERARMERQLDGSVTLGRVGAEALACLTPGAFQAAPEAAVHIGWADRPHWPDFTFKSAPTISPEKFEQVLDEHNSPALKERPALEYYQLCRRYGINPAVALAFFEHESQCGTWGIAARTLNWGNVRTAEDPALALPGRVAGFAAYAAWLKSLEDWCKRMIGPKYRDPATGEPMLIPAALQKYAPGSDGNNPTKYAEIVLTNLKVWDQQSGGFDIPGG